MQFLTKETMEIKVEKPLTGRNNGEMNNERRYENLMK